MSQQTIPATVAEVTALRVLAAAKQQAERDLNVAYTMFAAAHRVPDGATLEAIMADAVVVAVPEPAGRG